MNYKPLVSKSYKRVITQKHNKKRGTTPVMSPFLMKISVKQFKNRTFKRHLFFYNPSYFAIGMHHIDTCG